MKRSLIVLMLLVIIVASFGYLGSVLKMPEVDATRALREIAGDAPGARIVGMYPFELQRLPGVPQRLIVVSVPPEACTRVCTELFSIGLYSWYDGIWGEGGWDIGLSQENVGILDMYPPDEKQSDSLFVFEVESVAIDYPSFVYGKDRYEYRGEGYVLVSQN